MEQGLPCISTCEGGIPAIIEDGVNGFLAEKLNAEDTASKIETLLKDLILRKRMGESGREKFKTNFTLSAFEENFMRCMTDVLAV